MKRSFIILAAFIILNSTSFGEESRPQEITNNLGLKTEQLLANAEFVKNVKVAQVFMKTFGLEKKLRWQLPYNYEVQKEKITLAFRKKPEHSVGKNSMIVISIDKKSGKPSFVPIK